MSVLHVNLDLFCFSPPFISLLWSCHKTKFVNTAFVYFFLLLLSGKFAAPLWVPACTVLLCGGAGSDESELLRVGNFRELSARIADGLLDVIFSARGVDCSSKRYTSLPCWPMPARNAQALKNNYKLEGIFRKIFSAISSLSYITHEHFDLEM